MSNYNFTAWNKVTGDKFEFTALDDYFGRHRYGYKLGDEILTEEAFEKQFTISSPE